LKLCDLSTNTGVSGIYLWT